MKKTFTVEGHVCDSCGKQAPYIHACLKCGTEHCHLCDDTQGVRYSHGVHFGGSGDGYYCKPCDRDLLKAGCPDALHAAYVRVEALRQEEKRFCEDFRRRTDAAEAAVKKALS